MLRRNARLRREYLYKKGKEMKEQAIQKKKDRLKTALESNKTIPTDLRAEALTLQSKLHWQDEGPELSAAFGSDGIAGTSHEDDEYRWAGVEDPKVMITTSRDPSSKLKQFVKELRLIIPNSQRMNRGNYEMKQLVDACRANEITDFIIVHEHRGNPVGLIISHLPYGPTAYFNITDVVMRHEIPEIGTMSEQYPHLIFHNFKTPLGCRIMNVLKYLYPVPKEDSKRIITFANHDDYISFRHHVYKKTDGKHIEMNEVGPRFQLKLYEIKLGTIDIADAADTVWALRPYMNTGVKRRFLSPDDGWVLEEEHVV